MTSLKELEDVEAKLKKQLKNIDFESLLKIKNQQLKEENSERIPSSKFNSRMKFGEKSKKHEIEQRKSKHA